ncbi:MAG: hypothetical protein WAK29_19520 [Terriglobales bacterium]
MFGKASAVLGALLTMILAGAASFGQIPPAQNGSDPTKAAGSNALEFPVVLQQNVVAGKTPVGTKVRAKLTVATLVHGVVIPQDAILTGEVTESSPKSSAEPSRLGLRIDSVQWKNGTALAGLPLEEKLYLTAWYYPATILPEQSSDGLPDSAHSPPIWNGVGIYPGQRNPTSPPISGTDQDTSRTIPAPPPPESSVSKHRVLMKNVDSSGDGAGGVILTSRHSNIKLDKSTTYVLATSDLLPAK